MELTDRLVRTVPVVAYPDYRKLLVSNVVTTFGFWFTYIALFGKFVFGSTAGPLAVAGLSMVGLVPSVVVGPLAGSVADRVQRQRLLVVAELASAPLLVGMILTDSLVVAAGLFFLLSSLTEVYKPTQRAVVQQIVPDDELVAANSLLKTSSTISRIVGPGLAGAALAVVAPSALLAFDAASYIFSGGLLLFLGSYAVEVDADSGLDHLREGFAALLDNRALLDVVAVTAIAYGGVGMYNALVPIYVRDVLHLEVVTFGALTAITSFGAVGAGAVLAGYGDRLDGPLAMGGGVAVVGGGIVLLATYPRLYVVVPVAAVMGFGFSAVGIVGQSLIQKRGDAEVLGRLLGIYRGSNKGAQVGAMAVGGAVASVVGVVTSFVGVGVVLVAVGGVQTLRSRGGRAEEPVPSET